MTTLHGSKIPEQQALVATPEKTLLDLVYLQPGGDQPAYLRELRLQYLERLDLEALHRSVAREYLQARILAAAKPGLAQQRPGANRPAGQDADRHQMARAGTRPLTPPGLGGNPDRCASVR